MTDDKGYDWVNQWGVDLSSPRTCIIITTKEYGYFLEPCKLNNFQHKKCIISVVIIKRKWF